MTTPARLRARCAWAVRAGALPLAAAAGPLELWLSHGAGQPLADAVVFLESREARAASKPSPGIEIAQAARQFAPQVTVLTVGTAVTFPNRDTVRHHVYSFSPVKKFELKLYVGTPASPVVFDQPGIAVLGCNIHDQMAAWVVIVETPWYGQSGVDGRVVLPQVPPGQYRLRAWHPSFAPGVPATDQALTVEAGAQQVRLRLAQATP